MLIIIPRRVISDSKLLMEIDELTRPMPWGEAALILVVIFLCALFIKMVHNIANYCIYVKRKLWKRLMGWWLMGCIE